MSVTIGLAFLAGLASFLSPCVFALVPAYIGYLSGKSVAAARSEREYHRLTTLVHGISFVIGFSMVFITMGVAVSFLGGFLKDMQFIIARIGGIVVILLGLHMTGLLRIPILEYDLRPSSRLGQRHSLISSALMGVFFSAGWSPCVGPVLGAILTLAVNGGEVGTGIKLLSAYSAGLAIPFLFAAVGIGWVSFLLRRFQKTLRYIEIALGGLLIVVGILLLLGTFERLTRFGFYFNFGL